ncbi:MAG: hypothetical protein MK212_16685, partial [Saprospiraceae bacterium]|nr:hypothetical protein [Saprospiraceae bacterium]
EREPGVYYGNSMFRYDNKDRYKGYILAERKDKQGKLWYFVAIEPSQQINTIFGFGVDNKEELPLNYYLGWLDSEFKSNPIKAYLSTVNCDVELDPKDHFIRLTDPKSKEVILDAFVELPNSTCEEFDVRSRGFRSTFIDYVDLDFDGQKELKFFKQMGDVGGEYDVYKKQGNKFILDTFLTDLHTHYIDLKYDHDKQIVTGFQKSGCCHHYYYTYQKINNQFKKIKYTHAHYLVHHLLYIYETEMWDGSTYNTIIEGEINEIPEVHYTFNLEENNQQVLLFAAEGYLYYVLMKDEKKTEFIYPVMDEDRNMKFIYNKTKGTLEFKNTYAKYTIYENKQGKVGIKVDINGKQKVLKGKIDSVNGNLENFFNGFNELDLINLSIKE